MFHSIPQTLLFSLEKVSFKGMDKVIRLLKRRRFYKAWARWRDILNLFPLSCFSPRDRKRLRAITLRLGRLAIAELQRRGGLSR